MRLFFNITFICFFSCSLLAQVVPKVGEEIKNQGQSNFTDFNKTRSNKGNLMENNSKTQEKEEESGSEPAAEPMPIQEIPVDSIQQLIYDFEGSFKFESLINDEPVVSAQTFYIGKNVVMIATDEQSVIVYDFDRSISFQLNPSEKIGTYSAFDTVEMTNPFDAANLEGLPIKDTIINGQKSIYYEFNSSYEDQEILMKAIYSSDPKIAELLKLKNYLYFSQMVTKDNHSLVYIETSMSSPEFSMKSIVRYTDFQFTKSQLIMKDYFH